MDEKIGIKPTHVWEHYQSHFANLESLVVVDSRFFLKKVIEEQHLYSFKYVFSFGSGVQMVKDLLTSNIELGTDSIKTLIVDDKLIFQAHGNDQAIH